MGVVYRAQHMHLGRTVALKLLNPDLAANEEFRERFVRESRAAAELEHPNIVPVYDAGEVDGRLYLAMKFVEGTDLAHVINEEGKLSAERTLPLLEQLASALDAAHEHGLIHRDVKPANALLDGDRLYLTDFGLTRRVDSTRPLTANGRAVGTAAYLAPEQIRGEPLDRRVDVYALGCVMYQCLAGQPPYLRDTDMLIMWAHVGAEPPSVSTDVPNLPPDVVLLDASLEQAGALTFAQALREAETMRRAKIVLLTHPHARVDMTQLAPIVDDYLAYPFPPLQLFSTLREHIPEAFGESKWH